jgi:hypothetical protein
MWNKKTKKYAVLAVIALAFYYRAELIRLLPGHAPDPATKIL